MISYCYKAIFALWYYPLFISLTLLSGLLCLFVSLFSKRAARVVSGEIWASVVLGPAFIKLKVTGKENIPVGGGFIVYLNHRSLLDIPAAAMATELPITWVAKASLGRIPLFGWCLKRAHMLIERQGGTESLRKMVSEASERINNKEIISIFPEGTRNRGKGDLLPFKKGAFILSKYTNAKLLPIATYNTGNLWKAGSFLPKSGTIKVAIGKPLSFEAGENLNKITHKCYETLLELYKGLEESSKKDGSFLE
jgi:1-acyl-sn-glycerol-3-phosphate acyltransferase